MIQIIGRKSERGDAYAYSLGFYRSNFLFATKMPLHPLQHFSLANQQKMGKANVKLDISHIHHLHYHQYDYIIVSYYQDIIIVPYLLRKYPNAIVVATLLTIQLGYIFAKQLYHAIKEVDSRVPNLGYFQQSLNQQLYQSTFNIRLDNWVRIFSMKQLESSLANVKRVNYGEVLESERGIKITPYPSGYALGSSVWLLQSVITKQSLLWMDRSGVHKWRACKPLLETPPIVQVDKIVLTEALLQQCTATIAEQEKCNKIIEEIAKKLDSNPPCKVSLADELLVIDIIGQLEWKLKNKFKQIFMASLSIDKMFMYSNSYVEYLNQGYKSRIYQDPPEYPFQIYNNLKAKSYIWSGTLEQIAEKQKITYKELTIRHNPYLQFIPSYQVMLNHEQDTISLQFQPGLSLQQLQSSLTNFPNAQIYAFKPINIGIPAIYCEFESAYHTELPIGIYMECKQIYQGMVCCYRIQKNEIIVSTLDRQFFEIHKNWVEILGNKMMDLGLKYQKINESSLKTQNTIISLANYEICIDSCNHNQLRIIDECFKQIVRKLKFK